jgi:hypothetical protein
MTDIDHVIDEVQQAVLPFESWERVAGESAMAFAAFCAYRDMGAERSIRKAVESVEPNEAARAKRYNVWRNWAAAFKWRERAADYDQYLERLKQTELRKTIEAQGALHRAVTGKMLDVVKQKLDGMNPAELSQGSVTEWVQTAIKAEREAAGLQFADANCLGVSTGRNSTNKQGDLFFTHDFQGL